MLLCIGGFFINKTVIGKRYEDIAAIYLVNQGYEIIERNFRCKTGEIDIIAKDGEYIVFVEVKYRRDRMCGAPIEAVDFVKQRKISKVAAYYLMKRDYGFENPIRFDVVGILGEDIKLIKNAFEYIGR